MSHSVSGPSTQQLSETDQRLWATLGHVGVPFVSFVGPLIIFVVFKDRSPWLREQALEALNFSILYAITQVVSATLILLSIGMVLWPLVIVAAVIFCVMGAVASSRGEPYRYPINLSIIR